MTNAIKTHKQIGNKENDYNYGGYLFEPTSNRSSFDYYRADATVYSEISTTEEYDSRVYGKNNDYSERTMFSREWQLYNNFCLVTKRFNVQ